MNPYYVTYMVHKGNIFSFVGFYYKINYVFAKIIGISQTISGLIY